MMFTKKVTAPTTVSEAIAPFRAVRDNLASVIEAGFRKKSEAAKRIADAKVYAAEVEETETAVSNAAHEEMLQAQKIVAALSNILGEDTTPATA